MKNFALGGDMSPLTPPREHGCSFQGSEREESLSLEFKKF